MNSIGCHASVFGSMWRLGSPGVRVANPGTLLKTEAWRQLPLSASALRIPARFRRRKRGTQHRSMTYQNPSDFRPHSFAFGFRGFPCLPWFVSCLPSFVFAFPDAPHRLRSRSASRSYPNQTTARLVAFGGPSSFSTREADSNRSGFERFRVSSAPRASRRPNTPGSAGTRLSVRNRERRRYVLAPPLN